MVAKRRESNAGDRITPKQIGFLAKTVNILASVAERFGVSFALLVLLFGAVWMMGTAQTKDDFIRELLFGSVTHTRYLGAFFGVLILVAITGIDTWFRSYRTESAEMKRLADEKTYWQQRALGTTLSHTAERVKS